MNKNHFKFVELNLKTSYLFPNEDNSYFFPKAKLLLEPLNENSNLTIGIKFDLNLSLEYIPNPFSNEIYENPDYYYILSLGIRNCDAGEIFNSITHFCFECPFGQYSFNPNDSKCFFCPSQANYCKKNIVDLKSGYWRSPKTGLIYQCDFFAGNCL